MIRIGFTEIVLFLAPFALYVVFLWATKADLLHPDSWPVSRIAWLAIAALLLVVGSFTFGSGVGAVLFRVLGERTLLIPAVLTVLCGVSYGVYRQYTLIQGIDADAA